MPASEKEKRGCFAQIGFETVFWLWTWPLSLLVFIIFYVDLHFVDMKYCSATLTGGFVAFCFSCVFVYIGDWYKK